MYALEGSRVRRSLLVDNDAQSQMGVTTKPFDHAIRVKEELRSAGLSRYELWSLEARYLPHIIQEDEHIGGVIFGYKSGVLMMLIATDRRIILLDKKPLFVNKDEMDYDMVGGVRYTHAGLGATVTLHTRIEDYAIVTFNRRAAEVFIAYIESRSVDRLRNTARPPLFNHHPVS